MADGKKGSLVALRDRREYAIELLTERFAEGDLDMDEFESRVDAAHQADTVVALEQVIADLEPLPESDAGDAPSEALAVRPEGDQELTVARAGHRTVVAILGGAERKGRWIVPERMKVWTVMGGAKLDFREAVLPPGLTEVNIRAFMGGVEIIVPPHVAVESEGMGIMGGFEDMHRAPRDPDPERPLLRISGVAIMGGCSIETRLPGESRRQARRRERTEARQLRKGADKRLPRPRKELPRPRK
jgi:hypothetical protein